MKGVKSSHKVFNVSNEGHSWNMQLILVTFLVLKLERFNSFNDEHP